MESAVDPVSMILGMWRETASVSVHQKGFLFAASVRAAPSAFRAACCPGIRECHATFGDALGQLT